MAGGMEVHKNEYVERWATKRENLETVFRFNRRTVPICLAFGLAVPLLIYHGIVAEFAVSFPSLMEWHRSLIVFSGYFLFFVFMCCATKQEYRELREGLRDMF